MFWQSEKGLLNKFVWLTIMKKAFWMGDVGSEPKELKGERI